MSDKYKGYVRLWRSLGDNPLWSQEPFSKGQAWVDLFMLANHRDGFLNIRNNLVTIKRGQVGWSEEKLAERWKWSRGKVRRYLNWLETVQQIVQQKSNIISLITLKNYELYQTNSTRDDTSDSTTDGHQAVQQTDTNNNGNNVNNVNTTVPKGTYQIKIGNEIHLMLPEPTYEDEYQPPKRPDKKPKAGSAMYILAHHYLKVAGITVAPGEIYDAGKLAKGLGKLYHQFNRNVAKVKDVISEAGQYFNSQGLEWTPETVWRNWEMIQKWKKQGKTSGGITKIK